MKTLFVGQNSIHLESVDSTNSYASEMLRQIELSEGSVIYTFHQLKGRGQRGNFWESEPNKNVALSLVLYPKFLASDQQFLLTQMVSLAVADVMSEKLASAKEKADIRIKWPNDIYVNDKKIAGILIENSLRERSIQSVIIGIGININQLNFTTTDKATSMAFVNGNAFDLKEILDRLMECIEARYLQLKANKTVAIGKSYLELLYKSGIWANYLAEETELEGKINGVSADGKLILELRSGDEKEFDLKEIRFI